jgi:hypothetical protein
MSSAAQISVQDNLAEVGHVRQTHEVPQTRQVTGIHLGHNAAAALVEDGRLVFAMQEERLSRVKNQGGLPVLTLDQIGELANAHKPTTYRERSRSAAKIYRFATGAATIFCARPEMARPTLSVAQKIWREALRRFPTGSTSGNGAESRRICHR